MRSVFKIINIIKLLSAISVLVISSGCLVATQSFNQGKLLDPGERLITTGLGWKYSTKYFVDYVYDDTTNKAVLDSTRMGWFNFIFDYRIGVLRKYPFGRGLEFGYHLEYAMRKEGDYPAPYSPPLLELDTRFGLPDITLKKGIFHHNVNAGWDIGQWVDNGWFLGYAAGCEFNSTIPYLSLRYFSTATDAINEVDDVRSDFFTKHKRTRGLRMCGGISFKLPINYSFIPEYITPEASLIFPKFSKTQPVGFSFTIGFRWIPGF